MRFARDERGARPSSLYVDPYDAGVLGGTARRRVFRDRAQAASLAVKFSGDAKGWGRQITGVAALGLIVMLISGLVLRWPRRARSAKMWLKPKSSTARAGAAPQVVSCGDRHLGPAGLSGDDADRAVVFVRLVQGWRRLAAVAPADRRGEDAAEDATAKASRAAGASDTAQPIVFAFIRSRVGRLPARRGQPLLQGFADAAGRFGDGNPDPLMGGGKTPPSTPIPRDEFRIDAITGQLVSAERYADKAFGEKIIANVLDIHRGRDSGLARQARVHGRGWADSAVRGHRRPALSVAPQAAAPGAAVGSGSLFPGE